MNTAIQTVTFPFTTENGASIRVTFSTDGEWLLMRFNGGEDAFSLPILDESDSLSTFEFGHNGIAFTYGDINSLGIKADEFFAFLDNNH